MNGGVTMLTFHKIDNSKRKVKEKTQVNINNQDD